jgi:uncharacterized iron-regulated membrane protein
VIIKSIWLRKIHKWVGLLIGLQFLVWTISGAAMALLSMDEVSGGSMADQADPAPLPATSGWAHIKRQLGDQPILAVSLQELTGRQSIQITTDRGIRLFDAESGEPISIDRSSAAAIAKVTHPDGASPSRVAKMEELTLAVREHELPIWRVDFADERNSSYYVSGTTGAVLERRNDSWRWWDFFWMLHNMDYAKRTSFNHPLIIMVGFAMVWLAATGFWLLFRTIWRHDFAWLRQWRLGDRPQGSTR